VSIQNSGGATDTAPAGTALAPADPAFPAPQDLEIPGRLHAAGWRLWHLALIAALIALSIAVTWDGWKDLAFLATHDEESSHVVLVPIVILWLLWVRRYRLLETAPHFSVLGPLGLALAWGFWEYGYYNNIRVFGHVAAVGAALACLLCVTGSRVFWKQLPVFGVLAFAIPVPHSVRMPISMPLQRWTAYITEHLISLFGVELTRAGSVLTINGVEVGVAEACNGMRMVFALFLVMYLFVFSSRLNPFVRLAVLALAPLLALACNVIRLVPTVYLYGYASDQAAKFFHDFSGWFMIAVAFLLLVGSLKVIRWILAADDLPDPPDPPDTQRRSGGRASLPNPPTPETS
jgi:exosortase